MPNVLSIRINKGGEQGGRGVEAKISPNTCLMQNTTAKGTTCPLSCSYLMSKSRSVEPHKASKASQHHQTKRVPKKDQVMNYSILHDSKLKSWWLTLMCTMSIARSCSRDKDKRRSTQNIWGNQENMWSILPSVNNKHNCGNLKGNYCTLHKKGNPHMAHEFYLVWGICLLEMLLWWWCCMQR